jgi:sulfite exporter TauE/SafE
MTSLWLGWLFAALLGARHASEPDHLAAVSTLLTDPRASGSPRRGALLGAVWGMGHSVALLAVGGVLLCLRLQMPGRIADVCELLVAAMLLVLGVRSLRRAYRCAHEEKHLHVAHIEPHIHVGMWTLARRPFGVGLVHGLAGSGALTALALASMPSVLTGIVYMLVFGLGSVFGMALLAGVGGMPLRRLQNAPTMRAALGALAGLMSVVLGVMWGWPLITRLSSS